MIRVGRVRRRWVMLKELFFTLALTGPLTAFGPSTEAQQAARDGGSGLSQHAADTIVKSFLAAQRTHEENAQAQGSVVADLNGDEAPDRQTLDEATTLRLLGSSVRANSYARRLIADAGL